MSSYALGAIQMMTPSTFRRRNVTGRSKGSGGVRQTSKSKSNHHRSSNPTAFNNGCLPSTLTFHDHPSGSSSGNIGLSQLTMSQLSDTMSHTRSLHDRSTAVVGSGLGGMRTSKVARTMKQTRPSLTITSRNDNGIRRQNSKSRQMLSTSSISSKPSKAASIVESSKSRALKMKSSSHQSRRILSKQTMEGGDDLKYDSFHAPNQQSSQLRSQLIVLSPPRNRPPLASSKVHSNTQSSKHQLHSKNINSITGRNSNIRNPTKVTKSTPKSVTAAPSRKRSWMDACIDVMKTPYRTGKSIAQRITNVKVEEDDQVKVNVDEAKANANTIAHDDAMIQQHPSSFETPSHRNGKKSNAQDDFARNEEASAKLSSMLQEAKELTDQLEQAKKDIEKDRLDFEKVNSEAKKDIEQERLNFEKCKADTVDELNRQAVILQKEREAFEVMKKEHKDFHDKIEEAQSKFSVHVWSAQEKFNCHLDTKQSDAREELKQCQLDIMRALEEKQKEVQIDFDIKFASYFKMCKGSLAIGTSRSGEEFFAPLVEPNPNRKEHERHGSVSSTKEISISSSSSMKTDSVSSVSEDLSETNAIPTTNNNMNNCDSNVVALSKMSVPCHGHKGHQVVVHGNASKRVSPTKSQSSSTTNKLQGQCNASSNHSETSVLVQAEKTVSNSNSGNLIFITPMAKKQKHVDTKSTHRMKSSKYNLRSSKNISSLEGTNIIRSGNNVVTRTKSKNNIDVAGNASKSASTTRRKKSNPSLALSFSSSASQNENRKPLSKPPQSLNKDTMKQQTDMSNSTINSRGTSAINNQRSSRRRRRINGRAKLGLSQQSAFCSRNEVSEISTTIRRREGIREKQTPKNQGLTTPINSEVRRMNRIRQMRQVQPRVNTSPVGVACNIDLPMIPQLEVPVLRATNATFIKPRYKFLSQVDSDSLSFA